MRRRDRRRAGQVLEMAESMAEFGVLDEEIE
jgi:hypothetical protein